jgi:DNA replication and repair protein RecF
MINKISLANFRNFKTKTFSFPEKVTTIVGPNGAGKTNILEAIFLLATGKSFRARLEEEMVNYDAEVARVTGILPGKQSLEVVLTRGEITVGEFPKKVERVARKRLLVNKVGKRLVDFAGILRVVVFGPWDLNLVVESPSIRRKFLDTVLFQTDREYRRAVLSYEKGLRQRNRLLWRIREEGISRQGLLFWDQLLIKNGDYISAKRQELIDFINGSVPLDGEVFSLEYDKSAISEARLVQYAQEEVAAATTLVGPHRDDFIFKIGKKQRELARFGSRGEQRMGVLWLKIAELQFMEKKTQEKPVLLLDDIFSELDRQHRDIVIKVTKGRPTILTTADPHLVVDIGKIYRINLNS